MKVYISGPITGTADFKERFAMGEAEVRALGHEPVNPADWNCPEGLTWREYMERDIRLLLQCDGIYLLWGWFDSKGSRVEQMIAQALDYLVLFQQDLEPIAFPPIALDQPHRIMPGIGDFDKFGNKLTTEERNNE